MGIESTIDTPLAHAVRAVGSQSAYARLVGLHQSSVHEALERLRPVRAEDVLVVEAATSLSRHYLRPDIYPLESAPPATPDSSFDELAPAR